MARKNKQPEPELVEEPKAYISSGTVDSVSLHIPTVLRQPGYGSGIYYDENAATPEMLEEMLLMIRHKRAEAETKSETFKINKQGIFWQRFR